MKTLNRYLFKEIVVPFFLSLFVFTFVLLLERIMKLIELVVGSGVRMTDIVMLFIYILPSFLTLTIPMSFLLAVLIAFSRLSSDSEIIAMRASGVSLYQMMIPVSVSSILAYGMTFYLIVYALPFGNQAFRVMVFDMAKGKASTGIKERVFNDGFEGVVLYVDRVKDAGENLEGIMIYDQREKEGYTILAQEGGIVSDPKTMSVSMRLKNGEVHKVGKGLSYSRVAFSTYDLRLSFKGAASGNNGEVSKGDREMTITELRERISELRNRGENYSPYEIEMHKKFSIPFACIVFGLIGAPLGIQSKRSGRAFGFSLSLVIFLVYYVSLTAGENLGDRGIIPPLLAMWGINIMFLFLGIYLIITVGKERSITFLVWMDRAIDIVERLPGKLIRLIGRSRK
ncbi:MAG: LPS export ABC transporter permease LptF [Deltaproteobacteria bacterium]|nr:LPS export ABC transporter permease LptF [Deltaproteobacteria bacterium]